MGPRECLGLGFRVQGLGEIWGFAKIRGTFLGVPIMRAIVFLGLYWGSPILETHHMYKVVGLGVGVDKFWKAGG